MPQHAAPPWINHRNVVVSLIAVGVLLFMTGLYGLLGDGSALLSGVGALLALAGAGALVFSLRPFVLKQPHKGMVAIATGAGALHAFECFGDGASGAALGFFVWGMTPYALCLSVSSMASWRAAPVPGGVLALAVDLLVHREVFVSPQSSTAALLLIFVPLWNTLVIVPAGTLVACAVARRRSRSA